MSTAAVVLHLTESLSIPEQFPRTPMTDSDYFTIALFILILVVALLLPPGPGTPLPSPVASK